MIHSLIDYRTTRCGARVVSESDATMAEILVTCPDCRPAETRRRLVRALESLVLAVEQEIPILPVGLAAALEEAQRVAEDHR